ncbi:tetratricopeptide repeat-containing glycosyltransferase family protein [Caballeronia sp. J97]|uniref:tetratricopeptide repeat-containing glycosyltransferase family protein n=1 Tax=Caballeronia sp. J97 TaxID=2805429 RepID=UPI002AB31345|nr:tetratricopeptide repeat-containing glycosyltransferase family protein [Caballeronia sp. J97]
MKNPALIQAASKAYEAGDLPAAEKMLRESIALDERNGVAHNNLANLLRKSNRAREAVEHYRFALGAYPDSAEIRNNLAGAFEALGKYDLAEAEYRAAIRLDPAFAEARFNLGLLLLAAGNYTEGWAYYEARASVFLEYGTLPFPQWHGEDLRGKSILLLAEQGYGDTIQFIRYVSLLRARGAATVSVACKPELAPLMRTTGNIDTVVPEPQSLRVHDYWISLLSLPHRFGTTVDTIPARVPYLGVFDNRIDAWRPRLPEDGLRVGLVWKGNPEHDNDLHRSVRHFADLTPLWSVPGIRYISLQAGEAEDETEDRQALQPVLRLGRHIRDFGDTAAIVAQLNLVICVDTAIAHLAGALGIACWVMLPSQGVDWRWHRLGNTSPWYPEKMYLFRQDSRGWPGVIGDVKNALNDVVRKRTPQ